MRCLHERYLSARSRLDTYSKHAAAPDALLLLLEPGETLQLEWEKLDLEVRGLFGFLGYYDFNVSFQVTPYVPELRVVPAEGKSRLFSLEEHQKTQTARSRSY